jgi:hypothetical protein
MPIASLCYRENCSCRIRRKTVTPEATFFVFLFRLFLFRLVTTSVTQALPLETIKEEAGIASHGMDRIESHHEHTSLRGHHTHPSLEETWDPLPLSKVCNPYYEHPGVRQHEQQPNPLDVGPFFPKPVYILVSSLHTIQT